MATESLASKEIGKRFAKALFDLGREQGALDTLSAELNALGRAIETNADLASFIKNPLLQRSEQESAIVAVLKQSGASPLLTRFAGLLAQKRRLKLLPQIIAQFDGMLRAERGEVAAEVTSAHALNAEQIEALQASVGKILGGKKVSLSASVEPEMLGGVKVRIGSTMIDGSLRTKLDQLSLALKGAA